MKYDGGLARTHIGSVCADGCGNYALENTVGGMDQVGRHRGGGGGGRWRHPGPGPGPRYGGGAPWYGGWYPYWSPFWLPYAYGAAQARRQREQEERERDRERIEDELDRLRFERDLALLDREASPRRK